MPRPPRIDYPGAIHHVTNRGQNQQTTFIDDSDFELFLTHLSYAVREFGVQVLSYVLMTNHYHLLVKSCTGALSEAMQLLGGRYTQEFNRRHGRDGSLFKGRFFSKLIENEVYLLEVARYVPNNPVKAGMARRAQDYRWSSHAAALGLVATPEFLSPRFIIDEHFNGNVSAFDAFVRERGTSRTEVIAHVLEADRPEQRLTEAMAAVQRAAERLTTCAVRSDSDLLLRDMLLDFVCAEFAITALALASPRWPNEHHARLLFLTLLHRHQLSTTKDLAQAFGLANRTGVARSIRRFESIAASNPRLGAALRSGSNLFTAAA